MQLHKRAERCSAVAVVCGRPGPQRGREQLSFMKRQKGQWTEQFAAKTNGTRSSWSVGSNCLEFVHSHRQSQLG